MGVADRDRAAMMLELLRAGLVYSGKRLEPGTKVDTILATPWHE